MTAISDRLPILVQEALPGVRESRMLLQQGKDPVGYVSASLALDLRFLGVADYVLQHNRDGFRSKLSEAAAIKKSLVDRYDREHESALQSYVSMVLFHDIFNALAAGNLELAKDLAMVTGGREAIERQHDHPFTKAMGCTLKAAVLRRPDLPRLADDFLILSGTKKLYAKDRSYPMFFRAISDGNESAANAALEALVKLHPMACRRGDHPAEDESLFVRGIGLANLARAVYCLPVAPVPPLIPEDLLVPTTATS